MVGLKGNLAPDGAIVKVAGLKSTNFKGKACVLIQKKKLLRLYLNKNIKKVMLLLLGTKAQRRPGMREMLATTAAIYGQGMGEQVALITDGRFSGQLGDFVLVMLVQKLLLVVILL